ncbi:hypothetical protein GW17_00025520 [Ensete ventricosum]|nr:hypothetical protein GW17_00025520 [Ensete ventricosum]
MAKPRPRPLARGRLATARASSKGRPARKGGQRRPQGAAPACRSAARRGTIGYGQPVGAAAVCSAAPAKGAASGQGQSPPAKGQRRRRRRGGKRG